MRSGSRTVAQWRSFSGGRERLVGFAMVAATLTLASPATAAGVYLTVERAPGSERCPDEQAVFDRLRSLAPSSSVARNPSAAASDYVVKVSIAPGRTGHRAVLETTGRASGRRELSDEDPACAGLADAVAIAILVLADPTPKAAPRRESPAEPARGPVARSHSGFGALPLEVAGVGHR